MSKNIRPTKRNEAARPADAKRADMVEKRGVASNRQGIRYGARQAGGANEHFEKRTAEHSGKTKHGGRKPAHKTHEQRITKG